MNKYPHFVIRSVCRTQRLFVGATPVQTTGRAAERSATLGTGAWVGIAVGMLLLGMAIMALILLGIPRSVTLQNRYRYC